MQILTDRGTPLQDASQLMEPGCTLQLSDHPSRFSLVVAYPLNPDAQDYRVVLKLQELAPFDGATSLGLDIPLALEGEDETAPSDLGRLVQQRFPEALRTGLLEWLLAWRRGWFDLSEVSIPRGWHPADHRIPFSSLKAGTALGSTTLAGSLGLMAGDDEDLAWVVHDHYCANPKCSCTEVLLTIIQYDPRIHEYTGTEVEATVDVHTAEVTLETLEGEVQPDQAHALVDYVLEQVATPDQLRWRMIGARRLGKRAIKALKAPLEPTRRISRNGPCPCGSGKKYKSCCGRKR